MRFFPIIAIAILLLTVSCKKTPGHVISEGDMSELLADLQIADAIIDINRSDYQDDSTKLKLRTSIFKKHGITEQQFDTSLVWYGKNLDIYKTVCENSVKILEERQKDIIAEAKEAGEKLTLSGDSIDIWQLGKSILYDKRTGKYAHLNFAINADENTKPGDKYEWKIFLKNASLEGQAIIGLDYADGSSDVFKRIIQPDEMSKLNIQSDSTQNVTRIFGNILYKMGTEDAIFVDSLSLFRSRLDREHYYKYNTRHISK